MTLKEIQEQIIEEFEIYDDWMDKYNYLIELSNELPVLDSKYKTREYIIEGCQSKVWLYAEMEGETIQYSADSDAIITKGIVALLIRVMSGRSPEEIKDAELFFIDRIGLRDNLSPTRANGLFSMVKQMKLFGLAYFAKQQQK